MLQSLLILLTSQPVLSTNTTKITCPIFTCAKWVTDVCLYKSENIYVHSNCSSPDQYCPDFSIYTNTSVNCSTKSNSSTEISPNEDYFTQCVTYKKNNETLTPGSYCSPGLYAVRGVCSQSPTKHCKTYNGIKQVCGTELVCNNGTCIKYFSLTAGESADDSSACESGILINGTCQNKSVSRELPLRCSSDADCFDTDHKYQTHCKCTMNDPALSYCGLHRSDPLVLDWRKAVSDSDILKTRKLQYEIDHYPSLNYSNQCLYGHSLEHKRLTQLEELLIKCWAGMLGVGFYFIA